MQLFIKHLVNYLNINNTQVVKFKGKAYLTVFLFDPLPTLN